MTLVRNRLLPLSGNKRLLVVLAVALLAACSPKVQPVKQPEKSVEKTSEKKEAPKPAPVVAYRPVISLLLPFNLNQVDLSPGAPKAKLKKADLAAEYYQGFKLALDSLTAAGHNFKLQVFDTRDDAGTSNNLAINNKVRTGDIIVGPVYPDGVKAFSAARGNLKKLQVSPLSPAPPVTYRNNNLVTAMPPLEYHCAKVAAYINQSLKAKKVFILRSGYTEETKYVAPFKKAIDSLSKRKIKVISLTVVRGNLSSLLPQLSKTESNVFVVPSTDKRFLQVTVRSLDTLNKRFPVTLIGHPNWEKSTFLRAEVLQRLHTVISSGDRVSYKSPDVVHFVKAYRKAYHSEPGEYAIKGFDEGMFFGQMSAQKIDTPDKLEYTGMHNAFNFAHITGQGWVNTSVKLYKYENFELKPIR